MKTFHLSHKILASLFVTVSVGRSAMSSMQKGEFPELWLTNTAGSDDFMVTEINMFAMGVSIRMD